MTVRSPQWFVCVESNTTGTGRLFCAAARAQGMRPVVLAKDPGRYPYLAEDGVDARVVDTSDEARVREVCRELAVSGGVAGVTSSSEYFVATAAAAAVALGRPAPDPAAITRCRDKARQRAVLAAAGVPVPAFRTVTDPAAAVAAAEEIGLPVVLKPTRGSGSVGVRLCHDRREVADWAAGLFGAANERGLPGGDEILVEEYVSGPEFSVETFDDELVGVVGKLLGEKPYFVEIGHDFPARVPAAERDALAACARAALGALGLGWGAAHTELRQGAHGPVVIEVNPRLAGGLIPELARVALDFDLVHALVARVAGTRRGLPGRGAGGAEEAGARHAAIRFVLTPGAGVVTSVEGLAEAAAAPGVTSVTVAAEPGDTLRRRHSFQDRLGHVLARGADGAEAAARAESAAGLIRVNSTVTEG
ncbi:ATP-grasp domain-containing protein [Streptomyces badius]|uniref:Argininosuccinate lyase n=1 Tax=Streptomyces badius TaxID=1941 RepID=A0ABQ2SUE6_STRBA|nr:ATP-grasp domain-containing protein [Streptomyces badius]GGS40511.1 argininosuccinate lyase [Streptomyces badius]